MHLIVKMLYVFVLPFSPLLKRLGWLTREEAIAVFRSDAEEAARLLEEKIWRAEADQAIERKHLEHQKMLLDHDRHALHTYALSIGVPVVRDRALH